MLQLPHARRSAVAAAALFLTVFACARPVPLPASGRGPAREHLAPVPIGAVVIDDEFWAPKLEVWREVTIGDCFGKFERDGAFSNFDKIRDGAGGDHGGPPWYDGLIYDDDPRLRGLPGRAAPLRARASRSCERVIGENRSRPYHGRHG